MKSYDIQLKVRGDFFPIFIKILHTETEQSGTLKDKIAQSLNGLKFIKNRKSDLYLCDRVWYV